MSILINIYDYYITPDEYAEAERNGIGRRCLEERIRKRGWKKRRAITAPKRMRKDRSHMKAVWMSHGISYEIFKSRLSRGWDEWNAATVPLRDSEGYRELCNWMHELKRKHPREIVELAARNGISAKVFRYRAKKGWNYELASTLSPSPLNATMILKQKYGEDYCKNYIQGVKDWIFVKIRK